MRSTVACLAVITCVLFLGFIHDPAFSQAPDSLSFQGYLTDSVGNPMDSSGVSITFNLYKGGSSV